MKEALSLLVLLFLLAACAQQEPSAPVRPPAQAPESPVVEAPEQEPADGTFGTANKTTALDVDSVVCNKEAREISFAFKNTDVKN